MTRPLRGEGCQHPQVSDQDLLDREELIRKTWGDAESLRCPDCREWLFPRENDEGEIEVSDEPWNAGEDPLAGLAQQPTLSTGWNDMDDIDKCPICGGLIQSTTEVWRTALKVRVNGDGVLDVVYAEDDGENTSGTRIYCENDHPEEAILAALQG